MDRILRQTLQRKELQFPREDLDQEITRAAKSYGYLWQNGKPDVQRCLKEVEGSEGTFVDLYTSRQARS